jgi:hypothetical protein
MKRRREGSLLALPIVAVLAVTPILAEVKFREVGSADRPPGIFRGVADRDASAVNGTVTATASQMRQEPAPPGSRTTLEAKSEERRQAAETLSLNSGTRR